ncbi:hypothetical protein [Variovorax guangxiensis]|uniref:Cell envelope biogenesis protein TolA n=1 Tax=Variovorax guangxiensis TaxID=1775474 RepID=A0A502DL66_9BURK|nr:hypothetical protein [Variovorax guangxiensis]RZI69839.1 MAG: hypothetical protein EOP79_00230 [Variovorax sp.]TPG22095.1 hypothetical protein EAH83_15935 [Variovorax ginsengisoli]TPG25983.1 hypothetical protein EAH82_16420 [Variovorax guangxiensis]
MTSSFIRTVPAILALGIASIGFSAVAQPATSTTTVAPAVAPEPTVTEKVKDGSKKAYKATKRTAKKAGHATGNAAKKTGNAVAGVGHKAANGMRTAGHKIGEKIPGTAEHDAVKKP